jgi:hypothetical protein
MEKRKFTRFPFDGSAILRIQPNPDEEKFESQPVRIVDLSLKGVLLNGNETFMEKLSKDDTAFLTIKLSEGGPTIDMQLKVAHREGGYSGLHCELIDVESISHLRRMAELNLGQPELLDRELMSLDSSAASDEPT